MYFSPAHVFCCLCNSEIISKKKRKTTSRWSNSSREGLLSEPGPSSPVEQTMANEFGDSDYRNADERSPGYEQQTAGATHPSADASLRRRRRRSGSIEDDTRRTRGAVDHRRKRFRFIWHSFQTKSVFCIFKFRHESPVPPVAAAVRKPMRSTRWGEQRSICKFFREGYCRDVSFPFSIDGPGGFGGGGGWSPPTSETPPPPQICKFLKPPRF